MFDPLDSFLRFQVLRIHAKEHNKLIYKHYLCNPIIKLYGKLRMCTFKNSLICSFFLELSVFQCELQTDH